MRHPYGPAQLAQLLASKDLSPADILEDMHESPELYFADHVQMSREHGVLPLSEIAWRRACLSA